MRARPSAADEARGRAHTLQAIEESLAALELGTLNGHDLGRRGGEIGGRVDNDRIYGWLLHIVQFFSGAVWCWRAGKSDDEVWG